MATRLSKRTVDATVAGDRDLFVWDSELSGFGLKVTPAGRKVFVAQYRARGDGRTRRVTLGVFGALTVEEARLEARKVLGQAAIGEDPARAANAPAAAWSSWRLSNSSCANTWTPSARPARRRSIGGSQPAPSAALEDPDSDRPVAPGRRQPAPRHGGVTLRGEPDGGAVVKVLQLVRGAGAAARPDEPVPACGRSPEMKQEVPVGGRVWPPGSNAGSRGGRRRGGADGRPPPWLLIYTGARLNEVLTLKWEHVDLDRGLLLLPDSKTGRKTVYLNPPALAVLHKVPRLEGNPFVICGGKAGGRLVNLEKPWRAIRRRAGLDDVRLHDLRHTYASIAAGAGLSLPIIGKLLGHSQPQTTARYAHLAADPLQAANAQIGVEIARALKGNWRDG